MPNIGDYRCCSDAVYLLRPENCAPQTIQMAKFYRDFCIAYVNFKDGNIPDGWYLSRGSTSNSGETCECKGCGRNIDARMHAPYKTTDYCSSFFHPKCAALHVVFEKRREEHEQRLAREAMAHPWWPNAQRY